MTDNKRAEVVAHYVKTIESLAAKEFLNEIEDDQEHVHREADRVLILALKELGLGEIAEAWEHVKEAVGFWYS